MEKPKKVLVCGGTGFIGKNLVKSFSEDPNYAVRATFFQGEPEELEGVEWRKVDLRNLEELPDLLEGIDVVIQAAATTSGAKNIVNKPQEHVTDNAIMNSYLFRASVDNKVEHVIFMSCTVMYNSSPIPLKESNLNLNDELHDKYFGVGWTKIYLEKMCEFYSRISDTKFSVLRHSNIYGPHDKFDREDSHVLASMISKVLKSNDGIVSVWGDGEERRDLLYIEDLVSAIKLCMIKQESSCNVYNVGLGTSISINELVQLIIKITCKKNLKIQNDLDKPTIPVSLRLDCGKIKKELGWIPKYSLEEGLKKTIDWYKNSKERFI